jgi:hypothetical protein
MEVVSESVVVVVLGFAVVLVVDVVVEIAMSRWHIGAIFLCWMSDVRQLQSSHQKVSLWTTINTQSSAFPRLGLGWFEPQ